MYRNLRVVEIRFKSEEAASRVLNALKAVSKANYPKPTQDA